MNIHPRDFMNLKAAGKTVADMSAMERTLSRGKNLLRTTRRDVRAMKLASKLRRGKDFAKKKLGAEIGMLTAKDALTADKQANLGWPGVGSRMGQGRQWAQEVGKTKAAYAHHSQRLANMEKAEARWAGNQAKFGKRAAIAIGAGVLGTAMTLKGIKAFKNWRKKAKEETKYRGVDVYPEHNYAAVGQQAYNQPYYNEEIIEAIIEAHLRRAYLL